MPTLRALFILALGTMGASAFTPSTPFTSRVPSVGTSSPSAIGSSLYDEAVGEWDSQWPEFSKWGWGPSVQAEKWNGRHAMFGWVFICATAYAKGHGLIPNPEAALDLKQWGTLATISGANTISNERAVVLIANVHFLMVSLCATLCPLPFSDPLLVDPNSPQYGAMTERAKNPFGYFPDFNTGLTEEAELLNGRMAMLGLVTVLGASCIENKPFLDIVNEWTGNVLIN